MHSSTSTSNNSSSTRTIGPRAKCDQVVYEAIAKAAEIIVRGRCPIDHTNSNSNSNTTNNGGAGGIGIAASASSNAKSRNISSSSKPGSSVSRFHLEVEEVDLVR